MGVWHRARLRNPAETMPRAGNRPDRGVVRAACSLPPAKRRGRENWQHGPELEGCLTSMVRLRNAGRWERPDVWGQERDAPGQLAFDRLLARHGRPASCCPAQRAPRPPGGHCKSDIASLVVTEWHCFLLRPGDVADCPLGCVAVDAGLLTRGPSFRVRLQCRSADRRSHLGLLLKPAVGAGGRA